MDCLDPLTNVSNTVLLKQKKELEWYSNVFSWTWKRFQRHFYLSNPYDEMFESADQVQDYHAEGFPLLVILILLEWFILWKKGRIVPPWTDTFVCTSTIIISETVRLILKSSEHSLYLYIHRNYRILDLPWDSVVVWYLAALFTDCCAYWAHRLSHEINFLWALHQGHHSSEYVSLITSFRIKFVYDWKYAAFYLPMAFFVPPSLYLVHSQLVLLSQVWLHCAFVDKVGPLEWILNTPSHHRVHHGRNRKYVDKNYGAFLIIWDKMFGTFQEELPEEKPLFGLVEQVKSFNPVYIQYFYYGRIYEKWCTMESWSNKISCLIKSPGWKPGSPWMGYNEDIPQAKPREPYSGVSLTLLWKLFLMIHFVIVLFGYHSVNVLKESMSHSSLSLHLIYLCLSVASIGMVYDDRPWSPWIEFFRCFFFLIYSSNGIPLLNSILFSTGLMDIFGPSLYRQAHLLLRVFFSISATVWAIELSKKFYTRNSCLEKKLL